MRISLWKYSCARVGLGTAAAVAALMTGLVACPPLASAAATGLVEQRLLVQEGLAIALASNVLQSQLNILVDAISLPAKCQALTGGGSDRLISHTKLSSTKSEAKVDVYFDTACTQPYIEANATVTTSLSGYSITETAAYLGLKGQTLGILTLSESAAFGTTSVVLIGTGTFAPASGAPSVDLGLACTIPGGSGPKIGPFPCEGGIAQNFPSLGLSLASVTPLELTLTETSKSPVTYSVSFSGANSERERGAPGALSITKPTGSTLGIGGAGTSLGPATTKGSAAEFALFPPVPTHWTVTDTSNDAQFSLSVASDTVRNSTGNVKSVSTGVILARIAVDQSGSGQITYSDGTKAKITSWLLAD